MVSSEPYGGNFFAGFSKWAVHHLPARFAARRRGQPEASHSGNYVTSIYAHRKTSIGSRRKRLLSVDLNIWPQCTEREQRKVMPIQMIGEIKHVREACAGCQIFFP
jgi:hypothetical protein